jgi:hypothetical protein
VTNIAYVSDRRLLAQNPDTSAETLDELAGDTDRIIQAGVAKNPHASVSALNRLALSQHWQVRMAVVGNPRTGLQALQYLAEVGPSFSQTTRARHQLWLRQAARLPYQDALALRAVLESGEPSQHQGATQPATGTERGLSVGDPGDVRTHMSKHLDECARCSLDQPCDEWDQLFARYQAAGVEPGAVRKGMQAHLEDCELCSSDEPCPEWDELFAKFEAVGGQLDDGELSEASQPAADVDVAGSGSNGVPEVLSTGTAFQLLETATAYEVRAIDGAVGIPTSRYPRDPEGHEAAVAHFSRLENGVPAQRPPEPAGEPSAAEARPMSGRGGGVEGEPVEAPPPVPVATAGPPPNAAIAPPASPPAQPPTTGESPGRVRRRRWITGGLLTSLAGVCVLLIPFIPESNTTLTYSLSLGQGVCTSGLGQFAQALSASAGQSCGGIAFGFFLAWAAILGGIGAAIYGLTLG